MIRLTREIRFAIPTGSKNSVTSDIFETPVANSWAGWPSSESLTAHLVLQCSLIGSIDPTTDYLCNVKTVDTILREIVVADGFRNATCQTSALSYRQMVQIAWRKCNQNVPANTQLDQILLMVSPYHSYSISSHDESMILTTQQFEFSASHRLHNSNLTEDENRQLYGKCNNPSGHGHNYVVEISIADANDDNRLSLLEFQQIVKRRVIDTLDHRHLNIEVPPFDTLNPTVENIAVTIWNWLEGELSPSKLSNVRVYETPKTWADYRGE